MKTFYSAEEIENFAEQGRREIHIDENVVLTDLAKQTAHMLGIRIMKKSSAPSPGPAIPTRTIAVAPKPVRGSKPKGCQKRPTTKSAPAPRETSGHSRPVVDKLVEKIKRMNDTNHNK